MQKHLQKFLQGVFSPQQTSKRVCPWFTKTLLLVATIVTPWMTQAQTLAEYTFETGTDATKWVDMSTATQILTPTNSDGLASSLQAIGFTFPFGEDSYTQYSVNTDGNLRLGSTVTGTSNYGTPFSSTNANANNPKINAFGCDGYGVSGTHYVKALSSDSLLVVEYCMGTYTSSTRTYLYKWQIHLYSNGNIEIVFPGSSDIPTTAPATSHQCGLCVNSADGWVVSSSTNTATVFTNGSSSTNASGTWFDANRYYRFERPFISCPKPVAIAVNNLTPTSFDISWTDTSDAASWIVRLSANDSTLSNNVAYTYPVSFTSLTSNTDYTVQVASLCQNGDTSTFRTRQILTPCLPLDTLPYVMNFDDETGTTSTSLATNNLPDCWSSHNTGTSTSYSGYPIVYNSSANAHSGTNAAPTATR